MARFADLLGTVFSKFQLGIGGPQLKNNAGAVEARNAADSAYAAVNAALVNVFGSTVTLNAGATESGSSWKFSLQSPASGQTADMTVVWPGAAPSTGMALTVASVSGSTVTLAWQSVGGATNNVAVESVPLAFGTTSPVAMFTLPANAQILDCTIYVDTPWTGQTAAPSLSIGVSGTTSKYVPATEVDLTTAAAYSINPALIPDTVSEALIATYAGNSATAGAARIVVSYAVPTVV